MFVRKKMQVQKSFRIDEGVERDLSELAKVTERSQNDLANVALIELLQDNKVYFLRNVILDHFQSQIEDAKEQLEPFEMGGVKVEVFMGNDISIKVQLGNEDDYSETFEKWEDFEKHLIELSYNIDTHSEDTIQYLNDRTDYRDYVKIRKA